MVKKGFCAEDSATETTQQLILSSEFNVDKAKLYIDVLIFENEPSYEKLWRI